jgi:hypothetical protein
VLDKEAVKAYEAVAKGLKLDAVSAYELEFTKLAVKA